MYQQFLTTGLTNALLGTALAILVWGIFRMSRNCQLASLLWIAVFLKFLTPPFWEIPVLPANSDPETVATSEEITQPETPTLENRDLESSMIPPSDLEESQVTDVSVDSSEPILITDSHPDVQLSEENSPLISESETKDLAKSEEPMFEEAAVEAKPLMPTVINENEAETGWSVSSFIQSIFSVWAVGFLLSLFFMIYWGFQFDKRLSRLEFKNHSLQSRADQIAQKMGMKKSPEVFMVAAPVTPMIWSFGRKPVILMPEKLVEEVSQTKIDMILTHELAHIKRKDHLFRWIELIVIATYWWFPVVQWIRKHWHIIQEECCDAWVIRFFPNGQVEYGETLLESARFLQRASTPVWANELWTRNSLRERIETMLKMKQVSPLSRSMKLSVLLILGPLLLLSVGQVAQEVEAPVEEPVIETVQGDGAFFASAPGEDEESSEVEKESDSKLTVNPKSEEISEEEESEDSDDNYDQPVRLKIRGQVIDRNQKPIKDALVFWGNLSDEIEFEDILRTKENGNFELKGVVPGKRLITVVSKDWAPLIFFYHVREKSPPIIIQLQKGRKVELQVRDESGNPLSDVHLIPEELKNIAGTDRTHQANFLFLMREGYLPAKTDESGKYLWENAPVAPMKYSLRKKGYLYQFDSTENQTAEIRDVVLNKIQESHFQVVDAETGKVLENVNIASSPPLKTEPRDVWVTHIKSPGKPDQDDPATVEAIVINQQQGESAFYSLKKTEPGTYTLKVDRPNMNPEFYINAIGYLSRCVDATEFEKVNGNEEIYQVKIQKSVPVTRKVLTPEGILAAGAKVYTLSEYKMSGWNRRFPNSLFGRITSERRVVEANEAGVFEYEPQSEETELFLHHETGSAIVSLEELQKNRETPVTLKPFGSMKGQILPGEIPFSELKINVHPINKRGLIQYANGNSMRHDSHLDQALGSSREIKLDEAGRFEVDQLPEGQYQMVVMRAVKNSNLNAFYRYSSVNFEVNSGEQTSVILGDDERTVTGKINWIPYLKGFRKTSILLFKEDSRPVSKSRNLTGTEKRFDGIDFTERFQTIGKLKEDGTFVFHHVPPGKSTFFFELWNQVGNKSYSSGCYRYTFEVPEVKNADKNEILDLGEFNIADMMMPAVTKTVATENNERSPEDGTVLNASLTKDVEKSIAVTSAEDQKRLAGRLIDGWFEARKKLKSGEFVSIQKVESRNESKGNSQFLLISRAIFDPQQLTLSYSRNNLDHLSLFGKVVRGMEHYMRKRPDDYLRFTTNADLFALFRPSYHRPAVPLYSIDKDLNRSPYSHKGQGDITLRMEFSEHNMHIRYDDSRVTENKIPDYLEKFRNPKMVESLGDGRFRLTHIKESTNQNAQGEKTVDVLTINEKKDYSIEERWIKTANEPVDLSSLKNSGSSITVKHVNAGDLWLPKSMMFKKNDEKLAVSGKVFFNWKKLNQPLAKNERGEFKLEPLNFDDLKLDVPGQDNGLEIMAYQEEPTNSRSILLSDQGRVGRIVRIGPVTPVEKPEPKIEESVALLDDLNVYLVEKDQEKQATYFTKVLGQVKVYPDSETTEKILKELLKALNDEKPEVRKSAVDVLTDYCIQNHRIVSSRSSKKIYREVLDTLINRMYSDPDPMMKYEIASKLKNVELLACAQVMLEDFYKSDDLNQYYSLGLMQSMTAPWDLVRDVLVNANRKLSTPDVVFWNKLSEKLVKLAGKKEISEEEYKAAFLYSAPESFSGSTEMKTPEDHVAFFRQEITEIMTLALLLNSTDLTEAFIMTANNANDQELKNIRRILEMGLGTNKFGLHLKLTDESIDQAAKMIASENKGVRETGALILKSQLKLDRRDLDIRDKVVPERR